VIQPEGDRLRIVRALRCVDDAVLAVEEGPGMDASFDLVRAAYPDTELEFCNGGDRKDLDSLPAEEVEAARRNDIRLLYGVGGFDKVDSSTRINTALDLEEPAPDGR
jgi:glycerol-3-phosphate cytidylyltransferase/D-beta-D-heptose 7-phosphate kinase/D-beta-D-heptose 1-phosphate adenosyltransferase